MDVNAALEKIQRETRPRDVSDKDLTRLVGGVSTRGRYDIPAEFTGGYVQEGGDFIPQRPGISIGGFNDQGDYEFIKGFEPSAEAMRGAQQAGPAYSAWMPLLERDVHAYIVDSTNGEMSYVFFHDPVSNAVWIGTMQFKGLELNRFGTNLRTVSQDSVERTVEDPVFRGYRESYKLAAAAFEYEASIKPGYVGQRLTVGALGREEYYYENKFVEQRIGPVKQFKQVMGIGPLILPESQSAQVSPPEPAEQRSSQEDLKSYTDDLLRQGRVVDLLDTSRDRFGGNRLYQARAALNLLYGLEMGAGDREGAQRLIGEMIRMYHQGLPADRKEFIL